jgi:hypothetical protein
MTIEMRSMSMIYILPVFYESDSESGFNSLPLISTTNDLFEQNSSVLCQGILWKSHHFLVSFFVFPLPFFYCGLEWSSEGWLLGSPLPYFGCCRFTNHELLHGLSMLLNFCFIFPTGIFNWMSFPFDQVFKILLPPGLFANPLVNYAFHLWLFNYRHLFCPLSLCLFIPFSHFFSSLRVQICNVEYR